MTIQLRDAKKSETRTEIATIAGAKAHLVTVATLLEDAEAERFVRNRYAGNRMVPVYETVLIPAGETLYFHTQCGTARHAGDWRVYENSYSPADEVTCVKCLAKQAPVAEPEPEVTLTEVVQTVKVGPKWTTIYLDGKIIAEIANEHKAAITAFLNFTK